MRARLIISLLAAVSLAGCSTLENMGIVSPRTDGQVGSTALGERISLIPENQQLLVSSALQGVDFFLPNPQPVVDWPVAGGNLQNAVGHVAAAPNFEVAWSRDIGKGSSRTQFLTAPPVLSNGLIYTMDATGRVTAMNATTGQQVWTQQMAPEGAGRFSIDLPRIDLPFIDTPERYYEDNKGFGGGMAIADGRLYVATGWRYVAALDAQSGSLIWTQPVEAPIHSAPTVANGRVYVVSTDNELETFNAATGERGWVYQALVESARVLNASSPAVSGETVVATFASGEVVALQAANGTELWAGALTRVSRTTGLSEIRDIAGRPAIYSGDVFAGSYSGVFSAIDLRTGQPRWQVPLATMKSPWPVGDVVYATTNTGQVVCISRQSGLVYWITNLNDETIERPDRWYDFWRGQEIPVYWSTPVMASNRLVTVSSSGFAVSLDPRTGAQTGMINIGAPALVEPIVANGYIYIVTENGRLVAIG